MTFDEVKNIEKNFKEIDWQRIDADTVIYEKDISLSLIVSKIDDGEYFQGDGYDELLKRYQVKSVMSANFCYNGNKVYSQNLLYIDEGQFYIPIPVAVNSTDTFYENEVNLAKVLSENKDECNNFFKDKETIPRNF